MMTLLHQLAWRNLWRNKRRTIITILAVAFAIMLSVAMRSLQLGTYAVNIKRAVELFSGYLQIQHPEYQKNPSLRKSFPYTSQLDSLLSSTPEIKGYAPRVAGDGLISNPRDSSSLGVMILGIIPEKEKKVCTLFQKTAEGRFFQSDTSYEVVVGYKLMKNL
ncbi:MAG: ABC transporter permease, partial [Methanobacteriota archaeon]